MAVVAAAVVPHAPLIALGRAPVSESGARSVLNALPEDVPWVVLSPHGSRTGVRRAVHGSLTAFGVDREEVVAKTDPDLVAALARHGAEAAAADPVDQGLVVPLMLVEGERTVVPLVFSEATGPFGVPVEETLAGAEWAADAIEDAAQDRDIALVASAHTAAALTERGPLLESPEGHDLHRRVLAALEEGEGMGEIPADLWRAAGSCGAAPLTVLAKVCSGWRFKVSSQEAPFGVGYVCALGTA